MRERGRPCGLAWMGRDPVTNSAASSFLNHSFQLQNWSRSGFFQCKFSSVFICFFLLLLLVLERTNTWKLCTQEQDARWESKTEHIHLTTWLTKNWVFLKSCSTAFHDKMTTSSHYRQIFHAIKNNFFYNTITVKVNCHRFLQSWRFIFLQSLR